MSVRDLLKLKPQGVVLVEAGATTATAARMLIEHGVGGLPVVDAEGRLVGFLSERDVVRVVDRGQYEPGDLPVSVVMTKPAPTCSATDSVREVMARMTRDRVRHLVVLDRGRISGVISVGDLVRQRLQELEVEAGVLRDYVVGQRARR